VQQNRIFAIYTASARARSRRAAGLHAAFPRPLLESAHTSRMPTDLRESPSRGSGLVDVLDRVLDKGLVVAGDIKVSLAEVELLTIRIRLMICSIDKAEAIGLDWWKYDRHLSPGHERMLQENLELREQLRVLERRLASLTRASAGRRRRGLAAAHD
jgi:Gas vesicle protein